LKEMNWSGNIRELHNVVERLFILAGDKITQDDVNIYAQNTSITPRRASTGSENAENYIDVSTYEKFQDFKDYAEKAFLEEKLSKNNWNVAKTAIEIDIQRSHLYNKIDKYNLKRVSN
jgi:two-component system, NtrC family, nitrogen regulation response regulator NtrX